MAQCARFLSMRGSAAMISLCAAMISIYAAMISIYGEMISIYAAMISIYGEMISICAAETRLSWMLGCVLRGGRLRRYMAVHGVYMVVHGVYMAVHGGTWRYMVVHGVYMVVHGHWYRKSTWQRSVYKAVHGATTERCTLRGRWRGSMEGGNGGREARGREQEKRRERTEI
jgi:hypothetical protein